MVFFPLRFDPAIHLAKDVVQYGLAISRRLGVDLEIVSLGMERDELPSGITCHDLTHGDPHIRKPIILVRLILFIINRRNMIPVQIVYFWGFWSWISIPLLRFISPGIRINKLDGNPQRILNYPEQNITNLKYWIEKLAIWAYAKFIDLIACESHSLKNAMQSQYPSALLHSKLQVIPNGITSDFIEACSALYPRQEPDNESLRILFLGRVNEPFKGVEVFLKAIPFISADKVNFVICGQRGEWSDNMLRNFFQKHPKLRDRVVIVDKISGEGKVAELLAEVEVLCLPSLDTKEAVESFALVLVEAICSGVYFIASDTVPSAPDLSKNVFGEIFRSGDAQDLASKIDAIANDPKRLEFVRANGLAEAKRNYSWDVLAQHTFSVLNEPKATE